MEASGPWGRASITACAASVRRSLGEEPGGTGLDGHVHAAGPAVSHRAWQHPWLRIQRVIRSILETRSPGPAREVMKATQVNALRDREKIRRAGWFS